LNPEIINTDNYVLKNKVKSLLESTSNAVNLLDRLKEVKVYETDEQEAYDIMDKTHGGLREGIGTLPWDSFQKDKASSKRGKPVDYQSAFAVVTKLHLKKKDIKDEYTSYDRIFGNSKFKELFQITDYNEASEIYLRQIFHLLQRYKTEEKQGTGLSRIFNRATEESERFYSWASPQIRPETNYIITFNTSQINIFKNQNLSPDLLDYTITHIDKSQCEVDYNFLIQSFISPTGATIASIDTSIIGEWHFNVQYYQVSNRLPIIVKDYQKPLLMLKENTINIIQGQSIVDLRDYILISTNSININVINDVNITSNTANIHNFSFLVNNTISTHIINYYFKDSHTHQDVTACLEIRVQSSEQAIIPVINDEVKLLTFDNSERLNIYFNKMDYPLRQLISQINTLELSEYSHVLAASMRSVVQLLDLEYSRKSGKSSGSKMPQMLDNLLDALILDFKKNHIIKTKEAWVNEENLCNAFRALKSNKDNLICVLNCGAHTASSLLSETMVKSAGKEISNILTYIAILMN
jgi:hypothetical protein